MKGSSLWLKNKKRKGNAQPEGGFVDAGKVVFLKG
jgi:hypothetical protein